MHRPNAPVYNARRPNGATATTTSAANAPAATWSGGGGGGLWTCSRCNRNNQFKYDACSHCRSPRPGARAGGHNFQAATGNPFERYIPKNSSVRCNSTGSGNGAHSRVGDGGGDRRVLGANRVSVVTQRRGPADNVEQEFPDPYVDDPLPERHNHERFDGHRGPGYGGGRSVNGGGSFDGGGHGGTGRATSTRCPPPQARPQQQQQQQQQWRRQAPSRPPPLPRVPIDTEAAETWIYPINYPVRQYQLQIVTEALFRNTLVALPTGLGKTLIAAVVMYNFYRWFPEGKVVFLAPTKPLVAQQISACYDVMGLPEVDTAELQGSVAPETRRKLWNERRVFYCTPQSMANDIKHKRCDPAKFVCVVVDEAHRGTGNYAYVNVIREVAAATSHFRVLALSATPGSDVKTIQQVLINLRISNIECRSEDDPEVARHTHARQIEVVKCKLGNHIDAIRQGLVAVLQPLVGRMVDKRVLYTRDPMALKAWTVIQCLHTFRRTAQESDRVHMAGEVEAEMGILTKVVQAKDTLVTHGAAGCLQKLSGMEYDVKRRGFRSNAERKVIQHPEWGRLMKLLRQTAEDTAGLSIKHPKLIKLKEILREHFGRHHAAGKSTRAIVFTHLRDSVEEIIEFLKDEELLRVKEFIGQGNSSGAKAQAAAAAAAAQAATAARERQGDRDWEGGDEEDEQLAAPKQRLKGQTQKEQKAVVKAFFSGEFNCLVATCIAEEGLDIGEVDLIVSFDALNSPVRMVQRMGRTGRKRAGKVVVLVTEGNEESKLRNSNSRSKSINKALQARKDKFDLFQGDDPMVPHGPRPRMVQQEMVIVEYHLSQVGGHQSKRKPAAKKSAGSSAGGRRRGASGSGNNNNGVGDEDWRLTADQKATLEEAYMGEPGVKPYIPDPALGWRHQRSFWATGSVSRSARSKVLCGLRDFVQHQEWELLYDPSDMQLVMDNWHTQADDSGSKSSTRPVGNGGGMSDGSANPDKSESMGDGAVVDGSGVAAVGPDSGGTREHLAAAAGAQTGTRAPRSKSPPLPSVLSSKQESSAGGGGSSADGRSCVAVDLASESSEEETVFQIRTNARKRKKRSNQGQKMEIKQGESREGKVVKGDDQNPATAASKVKDGDGPAKKKSKMPATSISKDTREGGREVRQHERGDVGGDGGAPRDAAVGNTLGTSATALPAAGDSHTAMSTGRGNRSVSPAAAALPTTDEGQQLARDDDGERQTPMDDERDRPMLALDHGGGDDDQETQSDPECSRGRRRRRRHHPDRRAITGSSTDLAADDRPADPTSSQNHGSVAPATAEQSTPTASAASGTNKKRWRCRCGCVVKMGRKTCPMCGDMFTAAAVSAAVDIDVGPGDASTNHSLSSDGRDSPPPPPLEPLNRSVDGEKGKNSSASRSTSGRRSESSSPPVKCDSLQPRGGSPESPILCTGSSTSTKESCDIGSNGASSRKRSEGHPRKPASGKRTGGRGRWQCGCGCSMKAGSKRCSMCGQPRPPGHVADVDARQPRGVANKNGENSKSSGGRADAVVNGSAIDGSKGAATGRGKAPKSLSKPAGVVSSAPGGSDGVGVGTPSPAAPEKTKGTWMCVGCGNEYGAARLKCRACKTPRPVAVAEDVPATAVGVGGIGQGAARDTVSGKQVGNVDHGHRGPGEGDGSEEDEDEESLIGHSRKLKSRSPASRHGGKTNGNREVTNEGPKSGDGGKTNEGREVTLEAPAVAPVSTVASEEASATPVRNLSAGVVDGPTTAPITSPPRQSRMATTKPIGKRVSSEPRQGSMQHHTPESVQVARAIAGASGADESPVVGSGRSTATEDRTQPCPSPATQESQDNDCFAGLFPSLHQFEADQEGPDSARGARDRGNSPADMDVFKGGSTGGISRFDGGLSPLVAPAPPSMSSRRPKLSSTETSSARPPTPPARGLAIPPPPVLPTAPVARSPPPATPTKGLVLPPPPVLFVPQTPEASPSPGRLSLYRSAGTLDVAAVQSPTAVDAAAAAAAVHDVPTDCESQRHVPTPTSDRSCADSKRSPNKDPAASSTTAFSGQHHAEKPTETQPGEDDEWGEDAQGDTLCEADVAGTQEEISLADSGGVPLCDKNPEAFDGSQTADERKPASDDAEAAHGVTQGVSTKMSGGGSLESRQRSDQLEDEAEVADPSIGIRSTASGRESGMTSHVQLESQDLSQTLGKGGEVGNAGGDGKGGCGGSRPGSRESSSRSSDGGSGGGDRGRLTQDENKDDDDVFCGVCGDANSKDDDPILLCDGEGCQTAVHADCYGVTEIPEGPWLCEPCASSSGSSNSQSCGLSSPSRSTASKGTERCGSTLSVVAGAHKKASSAASSTSCALCGRSGGAFKRSRCGRWVHVVCVWWTPELTSDPDTVRPGPLSELDPARESLTCSRCHERGGAVVQCAEPNCLEACHPFCALRSGLFLREDNGVFELFCRTHSRRERQRGDQRQDLDAHAVPRGGREVCRLDESRITEGQERNTGAQGSLEGKINSRGRSAGCAGDSMLGVRNECRDSSEAASADDEDEAGDLRNQILTQKESSGLFDCSQSQAETPVIPSAAAGAGRRRRLRKQTLDLSDSEGDEDETDHRKGKGDGVVGGTSSPVFAAAKVVAARKGGKTGGAGGDTGDERGTPLKVFDMAPPPTSGAKLLRGGGGRGEGGVYGSPVDLKGDGEGCDDGLVTLSQAISPVDDVRKDMKRRRLKKSGVEEGTPPGKKRSLGSRSKVLSGSQKKGPSEPKAGERASAGREKGGGASKGRRCEYDKASYRRYIDHEAEVDEDLSDDDEAELDDFYDSQDSFVDDGPLSYETSSSQEEGADTPSSLQDTPRDHGDSDSGDENASIGSRRGKGNGKKKKKKRRLGDDGDEKGMYLQMMAMSQTPVRPGGAPASSRSRNRGGTRDGRGGRAVRGGGRCAFINAVMSHVRDGGDPFDIENACDSDMYVDSSQTPTQETPTPQGASRRLTNGGTSQFTSPVEDGSESCGGGMPSAGLSSCGPLTAEDQANAEPMYSDEEEAAEDPSYSQVMRQAYPPGSPPSSPGLRRTAPAKAGAARVDSDPFAVPSSKRPKLVAAAGVEDDGRCEGKENHRPVGNGVVTEGDMRFGGTALGKGATCGKGHGEQPLQSSQRSVPHSVARSEPVAAGGVAAATGGPQCGKVPGNQGLTSGSSSCSSSNSSGASSLTEQQRQKMQENRARALERLRQRQAAKVGGGGGGTAGGAGLSQGSSVGLTQPQDCVAPTKNGPLGGGTEVVRGNGGSGSERATNSSARSSLLTAGSTRPRSSLPSQDNSSQNKTTTLPQQQQQRGKSRMSVDMDDDDDDSDGEDDEGASAAGPGGSIGRNAKEAGGAVRLGSSRPATTTTEQRRRPPPPSGPSVNSSRSSSAHQSHSAPKPPPPQPSAVKSSATSTSTKTVATPSAASRLPPTTTGTISATVPLSAPRAIALEALARELRSRPGLTVHACPLGGGSATGSTAGRTGGAVSTEVSSLPPLLRDVDLVVGAQCAVCVRSRRQFVSQASGRRKRGQAGLSPCSPLPPSRSSSSSSQSRSQSQSQRQHQQGVVGISAATVLFSNAGGMESPDKVPPLVALLQANLSRYARVVVIVEGLEDDQSHRRSDGSGGRSDESGGSGDSQGDEAEQAAISRVKALQGVSVVASRGWRDTADKVVELVVEEERAGVGLPSEVTGPSLTAAQMKFLSLLLRAPTLSYPGGLFLLQAFRGRSVKEVISSAAKEFQTAVPGMTAQQAAKLKRFLVSAGASPRRNNKNPNPRNGIGSGRMVQH